MASSKSRTQAPAPTSVKGGSAENVGKRSRRKNSSARSSWLHLILHLEPFQEPTQAWHSRAILLNCLRRTKRRLQSGPRPAVTDWAFLNLPRPTVSILIMSCSTPGQESDCLFKREEFTTMTSLIRRLSSFHIDG